MIYDSNIWKEELKSEVDKFSKFIKRTKLKVKPPESNTFYWKIEKFFFITAYIIRKLNEANKLSDELITSQVVVKKHARKRKSETLDFMNRYFFDRYYITSKFQKGSLSCINLCHLFVHSFIFEPVFDDKWKVEGIYITSDWSKSKILYYIEVSDYINLVYKVITDSVDRLEYNRKTGSIKKTKNKISSN